MDDSKSPPQPKNQRRKRKDPESRDFLCKCGKSYLSYAAAYTHVKNKHDADKDFLNTIAKPDREKLKRGRPKEKKVFFVTSETEKLSIIEEAILFIYEALKKQQDDGTLKIILEGNEELRLDELVRLYDQLKAVLGDPGADIFFTRNKYGGKQSICLFTDSLNKHFLPAIAVKIVWFMNYFAANFTNLKEGEDVGHLNIDFEKARRTACDDKVHKLWDGQFEIPLAVLNAFEKWVQSGTKTEREGEGLESPEQS